MYYERFCKVTKEYSIFYFALAFLIIFKRERNDNIFLGFPRCYAALASMPMIARSLYAAKPKNNADVAVLMKLRKLINLWKMLVM